jgi:hypothetical protein
MPAPFRHSGLSTFMGSWPVIPSYIGGTPTFDPRAIEEYAVILGVKRETSAGYNVAGKTMYLWVDGQLVTFRKTINFDSYSDPYTLDQVITEINADAVATVAYNDNGFLRLQSPSSGEAGYLKLGTYNDPDVFHELGLFAETEAWGGQLKQVKHFDPDRQVAFPGQAAIGDGENLRASALNRALHQLAVNTDRTEGVIGRKRVATQEEAITSSYSPTGNPVEEGIQFSGGKQVFTGDTQTIGALENLFVVLDADGREFTKKVTSVLTTDTITFTNADGRQIATDAGGNFVAADEYDDVYVVSSNGTLPAALQGVPMKILEVQSANIAVIQPIDPATGDVVLFTTAGVSADRINYSAVRCKVDEIRVSQGGARVEGVQEQKSPPTGSHVPTRIDLNNRIVVSGAAFVTDAVQVGDLVTWGSYGPTDPYSNNGDYRVSQVVDEETIEVVADDWGPAFLNPNLATPGTLIVSTDGVFYEDPFIHFLPEASGGAVPESGDYVKILYLGMSTLRAATDDPSAISGGGVRYHQEADDTVQKAILALIGPSATSINAYLHDDARNSMENIDYRLDFEHYPSDVVDAGTGDAAREGRHKDIRPDTIDMWPEIAGENLIVRDAAGDTSTQHKIALKSTLGVTLFAITASGRVDIIPTTASVASGFSRIKIEDDASELHFNVQADGKVSIYENGTSSTTMIELDAGGASGVGTGIARALLAGESSTGPAAILTMIADAADANPLTYTWDVDANNGRMNLSIDDDGAGSALADFLQIGNDGLVILSRASGTIWDLLKGTDGNVDYVLKLGNSLVEHNVSGGASKSLVAFSGSGNGWGSTIEAGGSNNDGGQLYLKGGYGGASSAPDVDGGHVNLVGGSARGSGYSSIFLSAATAGASGPDLRPAVEYLRCDGATGLVEVSKDLDLNGNNIVGALGITATGTVTAASVAISINTTSTDPKISILQAGTGDAVMALTAGGTSYQWGIDNSSAGDLFVLQVGGAALNAATAGMTFATSGIVHHIVSSTAATAAVAINQLSTGDAAMSFAAGGSDWAVGIDNSDSDVFKIQPYTILGEGIEGISLDDNGGMGIDTYYGTTTPGLTLNTVDTGSPDTRRVGPHLMLTPNLPDGVGAYGPPGGLGSACTDGSFYVGHQGSPTGPVTLYFCTGSIWRYFDVA